jgi:hypothetical protein
MLLVKKIKSGCLQRTISSCKPVKYCQLFLTSMSKTHHSVLGRDTLGDILRISRNRRMKHVKSFKWLKGEKVVVWMCWSSEQGKCILSMKE